MELERYEELIRDAVSELSQTDTEVDEVPAEKITLSFNAQKDKIAAAHFDTLTHKISVLQDIPDSSSHDLAITTMHQLQPDEIHCSLAAPETLIEAIESFISTVKRDAKLLLSPWKDFAYETSKSRILQLNIRTADQPDSVSQQYSQVDMSTMDLRAKEIYMSGLMNLDCRLAVGAVGCLILALQRQLAQDAPEAIGAASCRVEDLSVVELGTWQVSNVLQIDQDALLALGVFATEQHASLHSSKSKEGLSLFNLLSETKTNPGTQLLLRRLRQPSCDNKVINDRLDAIAILVHPHNVNAVAAMRKSLSKVGKGVNVLHVLKSLKIGKTSHRFFRCLVQLTVLAQEQYEGIASLAVLDSKQLIVDILTTFDMSICNFTRDAIMSAIDFTESKAMRRMVIAAGFDEKLDDLRHEYEGLDDLLARVARQIQAETPSDVASEINVVYFPQIGYLIAIHVINNGYENVEEKDMIGSQLGWEYQFMTRDVVYFKSDQMCELDAHLGDLATMIADRETELVYDLSQLVIGYTKEFTAMAGAIAELDVLLALARVSELNRFNKPVIASTPIIRISQGRHPLQELCVDNFVQNDTFFNKSTAARIRVDDEIEIVESRHATPAATTTHCKSGTPALRTDNVSVASLHSQPSIESNTSAMVITGANGSGKSVYMKQVGLIVLMAHIGCYVPAESATIGLVDKIFTRIMCKESSSRMQSAFMIDLAQVSHAMRNASGRSLVLLDEFGKGTLPTDGAGVFAASLNYLVRRGDDCPFIIATTHFHDLWAGGYINVDAPLTVAHMRVKSGCDSEGQITLTHLHKLELELSKDSGAFNCALANNIHADLVERAKNISQLYTFNTLDDIAQEWLDAGPSEELIEGQAIMKRFLEWDVQQAYFDNSDVHSIVRFVDDHIIHDIVPLHEQ